MSSSNQKKIVHLLGVGFDAADGHVRITKGEKYDVLMGSDESHEYIQQLIKKIEDELESRGIGLDEITPEEFSKLVESIK